MNRWESGKLLSEMQTAKALLDNALAAGGASVFGGVPMASRVEAIYRDAHASGDIFRLRAVAEVMSGLQNSKDPALFHLAREAESTLHELRTTEEMLISDLAEQDAAKQLQTVRDEIQSVGVELGEPMHGVFAYSAWRDELARVQQVGDEVKFYDRGAPETKLNEFQPEADVTTAYGKSSGSG